MDILETTPAAPPPSPTTSLTSSTSSPSSLSSSPKDNKSWPSESTTIDPLLTKAILQRIHREKAKKKERNLRALWDEKLHNGSLVQQVTIANEWHRHLIQEANLKCFQDAIKREELKRHISIWGHQGKKKYLKLFQKELSKIAASAVSAASATSDPSIDRYLSVKDRIPTPYPVIKPLLPMTPITEPSLSSSLSSSHSSISPSKSQDSIYMSVHSRNTPTLPIADLTLKSDIDPENHNIALADIARRAHVHKRKTRSSSKLSSKVSNN